jgi:hypothetical protein
MFLAVAGGDGRASTRKSAPSGRKKATRASKTDSGSGKRSKRKSAGKAADSSGDTTT